MCPAVIQDLCALGRDADLDLSPLWPSSRSIDSVFAPLLRSFYTRAVVQDAVPLARGSSGQALSFSRTVFLESSLASSQIVGALALQVLGAPFDGSPSSGLGKNTHGDSTRGTDQRPSGGRVAEGMRGADQRPSGGRVAVMTEGMRESLEAVGLWELALQRVYTVERFYVEVSLWTICGSVDQLWVGGPSLSLWIICESVYL